MKKYIKPKCNPICLDMEALVAQSPASGGVGGYEEPEIGGEGSNTEVDSRRRSIWDDPFIF